LEKITALLLQKNPEVSWLQDYLHYIETTPSANSNEIRELHHILPSCMFPEFRNLKKYPWNAKSFHPADHLISHYYLYKTFPKKKELIFAFYNMVGISGVLNKDILSEDLLTKISLAYAEAKKQARILLSKFWTEERREKQRQRLTERNNIENKKCQDYTCDKCGKEFLQVTKGVFGGHRKSCLKSEKPVNFYHLFLEKLEFELLKQEGDYFQYKDKTGRLVEIRYSSFNDKQWFYQEMKGTTKSSLKETLRTGGKKIRQLSAKEREKYSKEGFGGPKGIKLSEQARKNQSEGHKNKPLSESHKQAIREGHAKNKNIILE